MFPKQKSISLSQYQSQEASPYAIRDLEGTINPHNFLTNKKQCTCDLCTRQKIINEQAKDSNAFELKSKASTHWLKKLLEGLCLSEAKTLKMNLPDLLLVEGQSFETFQTSRRDGRLIKLSGTTPFKFLYPTLIRYRKEYKYMLQLNFNQKMLESIDPQFMHMSYFQKFVPSHFHDGMPNIQVLQENKYQFKKYILHKNKKFQIQQIEEHKMNQKEPFCIVKYTDGNCQLFNQTQFEVYMLSSPAKLQEEIAFVQAYIKYKLETQAIYYSEYTLTPESLKEDVDKKAEREVMVLIGALNKFDEGYMDVDTIEEISQELMLHNPKEYVNLMTYKIVHYLNMTSSIYIDHIKIKWIMNDLGNIYLQQIMEFQMSEVPRRHIKYRLPPKDQVLDSITNTNNFGKLYLQMKRRKYVNTARIKKMVEEKPIGLIMQMMNIELDEELFQVNKEEGKKGKRNKKNQKESLELRTISTKNTNRLQNMNRYSVQKGRINQVQTKQQVATARNRNNQTLLSPQFLTERNRKRPARFNHFFTINYNKQQQTSRKAVCSSQGHRNRYSSVEPSEEKCTDKRFGSTFSSLKDGMWAKSTLEN